MRVSAKVVEQRLKKAWRKSRAIGWPKVTFAEFKRRWEKTRCTS